jgi:hypothetical protein
MPLYSVTAAAMPRINELAPAFEARTTQGVKKLEDYRGKWLVLFSHPADFTPVCTAEFTAFAKHYDDFQAVNTELLGLSKATGNRFSSTPAQIRIFMARPTQLRHWIAALICAGIWFYPRLNSFISHANTRTTP